jgi:glycosyltransferase involved in cell wall biosynthesis
VHDTSDVSLIIPACNAEDYLREAIQSALDQTLPAKEILVIDDGSTDRTAAVAALFGSHVKVLRQDNLGVSAARNLGIRSATGPWLAFLDSDDVMAPDRLEVQRRMLVAEPDLEMVFGLQALFTGRKLRASAVENRPVRPGLVPSALFCRASAFDRVGLFDPRYQGAEFIAWFTRARQVGLRYALADRVVVYRRVHDRNLSRARLGAAEYPRMIKELLDRARAG